MAKLIGVLTAASLATVAGVTFFLRKRKKEASKWSAAKHSAVSMSKSAAQGAGKAAGKVAGRA